MECRIGLFSAIKIFQQRLLFPAQGQGIIFCLSFSFSSTFIRTKALSVTYLSLNGLPTSSLYHFQNILYLLVHEIKLRLFKLESSFHLNHTPIYFSTYSSSILKSLGPQETAEGYVLNLEWVYSK